LSIIKLSKEQQQMGTLSERTNSENIIHTKFGIMNIHENTVTTGIVYSSKLKVMIDFEL